MAYDKVVDSAELNAGLKQIADAIRDRSGTSDILAFPTAMAEAIAAIQGGGAYDIVAGDYVPAENISVSTNNAYAVAEHNVGKIPLLFMCWTDKYTAASGLRQSLTAPVSASYEILTSYYGTTASTAYSTVTKTYSTSALSFRSKGYVTGVNSKLLLAGVAHHWMAIFEK